MANTVKPKTSITTTTAKSHPQTLISSIKSSVLLTSETFILGLPVLVEHHLLFSPEWALLSILGTSG
jgi:hypothetical protein